MANVPVCGQPVQAGYVLCVYGVSQSVGSWGTGIAWTEMLAGIAGIFYDQYQICYDICFVSNNTPKGNTF